ncbi:MAG: RNA polymerase-associated protein RapA [Gammaproteobacteria bacterium]
MQDYIPGQRWICDADLQMGLGTVICSDHRIVTVAFQASDETRHYAKQSAPLTRMKFAIGDTLPGRDGRLLTVESIRDRDGLLTYYGTDESGNKAELEEGDLADSIRLNRPMQRLFNGQTDHNKWFQLRYQTLLQRHRLAHSGLYGLTGCRTSLIPHQLYIAHEVAHRYAPRVLLADEVGLGKTIEAGLILHHQLLTERAGRVLIIVPESLVYQWLLEMLRRFNLHFSIFDELRCQAVEESTGGGNPFHAEQLLLCSLEFLSQQPLRFQQSLEGDWDLLVIDEAHHLHWSPEGASHEYEMVAQLAARTRGVLLLTATPEQLGKAGHFARLRLLDPDRFQDFDTFMEEERAYKPIADAVEELLGEQPLSDSAWQTISATIKRDGNRDLRHTPNDKALTTRQKSEARRVLAELLLDRHGTGRVLFRNIRAAIQGFPGRSVSAYALPLPEGYADLFAELKTTPLSDPQLLLCPELLYQADAGKRGAYWTRIDPRISWLGNKLKQLKPGKVLVITSSKDTAVDIARALGNQAGIQCALFHERMSLIERDRAAAYFADTDKSCQVLVCSEIGSEGRNFQFVHHLVLFDLPLNPDLLEQRIGRLDRIGQTETIQIHVPYLENSAQAVMYHWYHEGLDAFSQTCPAGQSVYAEVETKLKEALRRFDKGQELLSGLIGATRSAHQALNDVLLRGRDRLLEYNSCRPAIANQLLESALAEDDAAELQRYMDAVFDCFGIHSEEHSEASYIIRPGEQMLMPFPGLADEDMTITFSRDVALANEDRQYLSWEHPMVMHAMDLVLGSEFGNAVVNTVTHGMLTPGTLLLETLYVLEPASMAGLQSDRYLPPVTIRILIDENGNSEYPHLDSPVINDNLTPVSPVIARQIVQMKQEKLKELISMSEHLAQEQTPEIIAAAHQRTKRTFNCEIDRLVALSQVNKNIRVEEINYLKQQSGILDKVFDSARLRLDALRVIVAT